MTTSNENKDKEPTKKKKIVIPYVLPWESRPAKETQHGMKAFGTGRNVFTKIDTGSKEMPTDKALKSESTLTLLTDNTNLATQHGIKIGAFRDNVTTFVSSKEMDKVKLKASDGIIPRQSGSNELPSQAGETAMGALRRQVPKIHFKDNMTKRMDPESETFVGRLMSPNPNCHAGTAVIDKMRKQVPEIYGLGKKSHDRETESILPKLQDMKDLATCEGTGAGTHGLGPFRQVITPVTGGYTLSSDEIIASKKIVPWITSPRLSSQAGTGGFQKTRDVVSHVRYQW